MRTDVRLPEIADSVTAAKLVAWVVREGDRVVAGQPIAEVETDKTTMEIEAPAAGVLGTIRVPAGPDLVPVGTVIAVIVDDPAGVTVSDVRVDAVRRPQPSADRPSPEPSGGAAAPLVPLSERSGGAATPLAAKMAKLAALDLA